MVPTGVFQQELHEPSNSKGLAKATKVVESSQETPPPSKSIPESTEVMEIHSDWRTPFMIYCRTGGLLEDKVDHERLHHRAGQYPLVNDELFQLGANGSAMKCVTLDKGCAILQGIHTGICGSHMGLGLSWARHICRGSFGPLLSLMPTT
jgi:hypothetical protein